MSVDRDAGVDARLSVLKTSVKVGAISASLGGTVGAVAALFRGVNPFIFAAASGVQCFAIGTSYWAVKQGQLAYQASSGRTITPSDRVRSSTIAGGASGALVATVFRGRRNIVPGVVVFSAFGCLGQSIYNRLQQRHINRAPDEEKPSILQRIANSPYTPVKLLSDKDYEDMLAEKLIRIDAEIALVDEDIERLRMEDSQSSITKET